MRKVEGRIGIISGAGRRRGAQTAELAGEGRLGTRKAEAAKAKIAEICAQTGLVPRSGVPDDIAQALLWFASNRCIFDARDLHPAPRPTEARRSRAGTFVPLSLLALLHWVIACRCPELRH